MYQTQKEDSILLETITAVSSSLDLNATLSKIANILGQAIDVTSAYIVDWDETQLSATVVAEYLSENATIAESISDLGDAYTLALTQETIPRWLLDPQIDTWHVVDTNLPERITNHMRQYGAKSVLYVPIKINQKLIAFAELWESRHRRDFTLSEIKLCQAIAQQAATAINNARLYQLEIQRRREAETLNEVVAHLTATLDVDDVMGRTINLIRRYLKGIQSCSILLLEKDDQFLKVVSHWDEDEKFTPPFVDDGEWVNSTYIGRRVLEDSSPVMIAELKLHPFSTLALKNAIKRGLRAVLYLPLLLHNKSIGLIQIHVWYTPRHFTDEEIGICLTIANQAAVAYENARLHAESQRQMRELAVLNQVAIATAKITNIDELLFKTTDIITKNLYSESFGFILVDAKNKKLILHQSYFGVDSALLGKEIPQDHSIADLVMKNKEAYIIQDVRDEPRYYNAVSEMLSETAVPVIIDGVVIAVINVKSTMTNTFSSEDTRFLNTLAGQVATALERARLYNLQEEQKENLARQIDERIAELQSERDRTYAILESAGEGIILTDVEATILYANPAMEKQTGYSREEMLGKTPKIFNSGQTSKSTFQAMWKTVLVGQFWSGEVINKRKDGFTYNTSLTITPLVTAGEVNGFVSVLSDITHFKEVDRLKDEFISRVTHELRTPLTNIKTYLSLLQRGKPEKRERYYQVLHYETDRLTGLIQDILDLSKLDLEPALNWGASINPSARILHVLATFAVKVEEKEITLVHEFEDNVPNVCMSQEHFDKVLANLIINGIAYTPRNGRISINLSTAKDGVLLIIEDNGVGISEEERKHIFERFFRGQAALENGIPGAGLGLAIASDIVTRYGGEIQVESEFKQGAKFSVLFPHVSKL